MSLVIPIILFLLETQTSQVLGIPLRVPFLFSDVVNAEMEIIRRGNCSGNASRTEFGPEFHSEVPTLEKTISLMSKYESVPDFPSDNPVNVVTGTEEPYQGTHSTNSDEEYDESSNKRIFLDERIGTIFDKDIILGQGQDTGSDISVNALSGTEKNYQGTDSDGKNHEVSTKLVFLDERIGTSADKSIILVEEQDAEDRNISIFIKHGIAKGLGPKYAFGDSSMDNIPVNSLAFKIAKTHSENGSEAHVKDTEMSIQKDVNFTQNTGERFVPNGIDIFKVITGHYILTIVVVFFF